MKIHPIFNETLLKPYTEHQDLNRDRKPLLRPNIEVPEEQWEIEEILDAQKQGNRFKLLIRWNDLGTTQQCQSYSQRTSRRCHRYFNSHLLVDITETNDCNEQPIYQ